MDAPLLRNHLNLIGLDECCKGFILLLVRRAELCAECELGSRVEQGRKRTCLMTLVSCVHISRRDESGRGLRTFSRLPSTDGSVSSTVRSTRMPPMSLKHFLSGSFLYASLSVSSTNLCSQLRAANKAGVRESALVF